VTLQGEIGDEATTLHIATGQHWTQELRAVATSLVSSA
jgi:hypothetical protein